MKLKKLHITFIAALIAISNVATAQLFIDNATFFIQPGASVTVQGDVTSNVSIQGTGRLILKGTANQNINMGGFTIPNLEIDNAANATLTGAAQIGSTLLFTNGKIILGTNNLTLASVATVSGQGTGKFAETNGTGRLVKLLTANVANYELPLGYGTSYQPAFISSTGTYAAGAFAAVQTKGTAHPNKHPRSTDFLNLYWPVTQSGITGTLRATGKYFANFTGAETDLRGIVYTAGNWRIANANISTAADTAGALIPATGGDLYAMNKFVLLKNKAFLQGSFNTTTGLMNDNLRTLASFPTSDPYRTAPYSSYFTHTNNTSAESIISPAAVLGVQALADNNVVDWVFVELRSAISPGNTIVQTRSALLQRDGDLVDIDGASPLYFKNIDSANFTIAVRHRNHLGLSTDPASLVVALNERIPATTLDLTTATDAQLFGTANTNFALVSGKNLLYAGNVSGNGIVRYQGTNGPGPNNVSDRVALLTDLGNNELATFNTYHRGDVTMNGITRYQGTNGPGPNNVSDRVFILGTVLSNTELATKAQALPN